MANGRPAHLRGLNDTQVALYHKVNADSAKSGMDFWTRLTATDADPEDKWQVAEAMGYSNVADREYAVKAGRDPHRGKVAMTTLKRGQHFTGPDGHTEYVVTTPASEDKRGWVLVWNLSMSDDEVLKRMKYAEKDHDGKPVHPRSGFFAYSFPTYVEVIG